MSSDPLRVLWDTLAAHGCRPHGKEYDFRARCPGHDGENFESLHVSIGADLRAVVWCFARGCKPEAITGGLGLTVRDLFPAGHYRAARQPMIPVKRADFKGAALHVANVLHALERLGEPWQLMLTSTCPYCGFQGAWLRANSDGNADADCPLGCDADRYVQALLGRLRDLDGEAAT